jgi:hypothetical protein
MLMRCSSVLLHLSLALSAVGPVPARAQVPAILLEACNALPDAQRRLECLKAANERPSPASPSAATIPPAPGLYDDFVRKAKAMLLRDLKDPDSARFRSLFVARQATVLCGEVNARSTYGGLTGFERFYVDTVTQKTNVELSRPGGARQIFIIDYEKACRDKVADIPD